MNSKDPSLHASGSHTLRRLFTPRNLVVFSAIALVPLIYAGLLTSSNVDPTHRLDHVPAVIVNEDQSAESATGDTLTLGDDLVDELTSSDATNNFDWSIASASTAKRELSEGSAYAVLTIPRDFSSDVASLGGDDATQAAQAKLSIETDDSQNMIIGTIASTLGTTVTDALRDTVSAEYLDQIYLGFTDVHDQLGDAASGSAQLADGAAELATGTGSAQAGANSLAAGLGELRDATRALPDQAAQLNTGAHQIAAGTGTLRTTADSLKHAADSLDSDLPTLTGSVSDDLDAILSDWNSLTDDERQQRIEVLRADAQQVHEVAEELQGDAPTLSAAASQAVRQIDALDDGAHALATGTQQLADSARPLADGIATAASGSSTLASGIGQLADGAQQLAEGSDTLRRGLDDGVAQVPHYSDAEADHLSSVAATPVAIDATRAHEVSGYGAGLAPYFLSLALWVGAMAFYLMAKTINQRLVDERRPFWLITLRSMLPGAIMGFVQGILAALVLHFWVGIPMTHFPAVVGITVLAGVTFMAVNQALIALLDAPGRFLGLVLIVLQLASAGGTYPVETAPGIFQWMHTLLPITYTVEALRTLIAGGSTAAVSGAILTLLIWLGAALVLSLTASVIHLRRHGGKGRTQVGDEVFRALEPDGEPHEAGRDSEAFVHLGGETHMRRAERMDGHRPRVTNARHA